MDKKTLLNKIFQKYFLIYGPPISFLEMLFFALIAYFYPCVPTILASIGLIIVLYTFKKHVKYEFIIEGNHKLNYND